MSIEALAGNTIIDKRVLNVFESKSGVAKVSSDSEDFLAALFFDHLETVAVNVGK